MTAERYNEIKRLREDLQHHGDKPTLKDALDRFRSLVSQEELNEWKAINIKKIKEDYFKYCK